MPGRWAGRDSWTGPSSARPAGAAESTASPARASIPSVILLKQFPRGWLQDLMNLGPVLASARTSCVALGWSPTQRDLSVLVLVVIAARSCLTLCGPVDCSPTGSYVHGIFQARILECVAISFPKGILPTQRLEPRFVRSLPLHRLG